MKRCVICGYYGFGNLGDDLILKIILDWLREYDPGMKATVLSAAPSLLNKYPGTQMIWRYDLVRIILHTLRSKVFILGGGGLIQDQTSFRSLFYYLFLAALALVLRRPVFVFAVGVEPLKRGVSRRLVKWIFNQDRVCVTVRDELSRHLLEELGVNRGKVTVTADPVFSLDLSLPKNTPPASTPLSRVLIIGRMGEPGEAGGFYVKLEKVLKSMGCHTTERLSFQPYGGSLIPSSQPLADHSLMASLHSSGMIISARYHGLIFALLRDMPFVGLGDSNKIKHICNESGRPFLSWEECRNIAENELLEILRFSSTSPPLKKRDWLLDSRRTMELLASFIKPCE